uniref:Uncharacterized protein n=1 Tax=Knipowitschia caucasica TaxID=637954 RepID=A0AAV2JMP7_KNICA
MACGWTKAEAIVTDVLAPAFVEDCLKVLKRPLNEQREATNKEDQCPKSLWRLFKDDQDGEGNPLDLQVYLSFLSNALKIFHDTVLVLEREDGTVCELYDMMFTLKTKLHQQQSDGFLGAQTGVLLQQFPDRQAAVLREDMCNFYQSSLTYLEQRYDFSDSNYQKKVASH